MYDNDIHTISLAASTLARYAKGMNWSSLRALGLSSALFFIAPHVAAAESPAASSSTTPSPPAALPPPPAPEDSAPETTPSETSASRDPLTAETAGPDKPIEPVVPIPTMATPQKGLPRLRIEADRPGVRLMRIDRVMSDEMGEGMLVKSVCAAPCDQVIDGRKRQTFFFGADGMVPSRGFRLSRLDGDIVAHVHGGSIVARQVGFLFGAFGGAAMLGGATMLGVGYTKSESHLSNEGKVVEGPNPTLTTGGFIVLGAGAAMITTAIVLVLTAKTKIMLTHAGNHSPRVAFEGGVLRF